MQDNFNPMLFNMMLNMMNNMYPNMGYNMGNFNNFNNQMLMNMMMNWMNMNPCLFQIYNNMETKNNNFNQFNNNINQMNNNYMKITNSNINQIKENGGGLISKNIPNSFYDISNYSDEPKINVAFTTQKGQKMMIVAPANMTVKDLLVQYVIRLGLGPGVMADDSIYFMFNGLRINQNESKTLDQFFTLGTGGAIIVIDTKNIIGA